MLPITRTHKPDTIELAKWSFWPEEWKRTKRSHPMINARVETANVLEFATNSPLPDARRQLLRVAAGRHTQTAVSHHAEDRRAMAGIYTRKPTEFDTAEKNPVNFAILTTQANDAVSYIHDRMPVILPLGCEKNWLQANPSAQFFVPEFPPAATSSPPKPSHPSNPQSLHDEHNDHDFAFSFVRDSSVTAL